MPRTRLKSLAARALLVLSAPASAAMADVQWQSHFSQVRWSGLIGVGGDGVQWNVIDSHGSTNSLPLFNGGTWHTEYNYNMSDPQGGWIGENTSEVRSRAGYFENGVAGFAAGVDVFTQTESTSNPDVVLMDAHAEADYRLDVTVSGPTAFTFRGVGQYEGFASSMRFSRVSDGATVYWSIFQADGEQVIDTTGVLGTGTWRLEVYHAVRVFGPGTAVKNSRLLLTIGNLYGDGCNLADITEIGGTAEAPGAPDQQLTVDDIIVFVNLFIDATGCGDSVVAVPCSRADVCGIGGPPEEPDGQLTVDDIIAFVNAFSDGC